MKNAGKKSININREGSFFRRISIRPGVREKKQKKDEEDGFMRDPMAIFLNPVQQRRASISNLPMSVTTSASPESVPALTPRSPSSSSISYRTIHGAEQRLGTTKWAGERFDANGAAAVEDAAAIRNSLRDPALGMFLHPIHENPDVGTSVSTVLEEMTAAALTQELLPAEACSENATPASYKRPKKEMTNAPVTAMKTTVPKLSSVSMLGDMVDIPGEFFKIESNKADSLATRPKSSNREAPAAVVPKLVTIEEEIEDMEESHLAMSDCAVSVEITPVTIAENEIRTSGTAEEPLLIVDDAFSTYGTPKEVTDKDDTSASGDVFPDKKIHTEPSTFKDHGWTDGWLGCFC